MLYRIWAVRNGGYFGSAADWCKVNGEPIEVATREEAQKIADQWASNHEKTQANRSENLPPPATITYSVREV